jgi:hypothetical protein
MIYLIWFGYGILIPIIIFVDSLIAELITRAIANDDGAYEKNLMPLGLSLLVSALLILSAYKYFEKKKREKRGTRVFDIVTISKPSRFFFVPFLYWTYITAAIGIIIIIGQIAR